MGYKIREAREKANMTQEELASASGVSRVTISLLETGATNNASSKTLLKIAKALGVTIDSIFFEEAV